MTLRRILTVIAAGALLAAACAAPTSVGEEDSPRVLVEARKQAAQREEATAESVDRIRVCMETAGFDVDIERDEFGGIGIVGDAPPEQHDTYDEVFESCSTDVFGDMSSGTAARDGAALSDEYLSALYAYYLVLAECLRSEGYEVPTAPSRDVFAEMSPRWSPYDGLEPGREVPASSWRDLNATCPQQPPFRPSDF